MNKLMRAGALALAMATMVTGCSSGTRIRAKKKCQQMMTDNEFWL